MKIQEHKLIILKSEEKQINQIQIVGESADPFNFEKTLRLNFEFDVYVSEIKRQGIV